MLESKSTTLQDIAFKVAEEQIKSNHADCVKRERTLFVLGSKGVGKTTLINNFLDRQDTIKPTLALEFSFGRRSSSVGQDLLQKQICNVWELGSLTNSNELIAIPLKSHGLENFIAIIMLDISQPERLWADLECSLKGLKNALKDFPIKCINELKELTRERISSSGGGNQHPDINSLELLPFPVLIIGGNYDKFQDLDPEVKKHVCRCLRSVAHTIGSALIFYSDKISNLSKIVRDTLNHFGFGSPMNPFRTTSIDYNGPLMIWFGKDSWTSIGVTPTNSERIGITYNTHISQIEIVTDNVIGNPATDMDFREGIIDEMRSQKDEELLRFIKDTEIRSKFQAIIT